MGYLFYEWGAHKMLVYRPSLGRNLQCQAPTNENALAIYLRRSELVERREIREKSPKSEILALPFA